MKYFIPAIAGVFSVIGLFSQDVQVIDSLEQEITTLKAEKSEQKGAASAVNDSLIIKNLLSLSDAYWTSDPEKSIQIADEAMALSKSINNQHGIAGAYHSLGTAYSNIGDYDRAVECFESALAIRKTLGIPSLIGASYLNLGDIYRNQGNYPKALEYDLLALRNFEAADDQKNIAGAFVNIGVVKAEMGELEEAFANFEKGRLAFVATGNKGGEAYALGNLGVLSNDMGLFAQGFHYDSLSLALHTSIGNQAGVANTYNNLAYNFEQMGNDNEALVNYNKAIAISRAINQKNLLAMNLANVGALYGRQKKYKLAEENFTEALAIAEEMNSPFDISDIELHLTQLDSARGDYRSALVHYRKHIAARDAMFNEENTKELTRLGMQYTFDKRELALAAGQERKDALAREEVARQKLVRNGFAGGFVVVLGFAGIFFFQRNKIKKGKALSDELLLNILPAETAEELKRTGKAAAKSFDEVTVLFTDFKNFTAMSEKLSAHELVEEINYCYSAFDRIVQELKIEKIKTIGDSYMCAGGLPVENRTNAIDTVQAALAFRDFVVEERARRLAQGRSYFEIRIGCHTGPVVAGIVGIKKYSYDIWGDTVNVASRMESGGEPGKVNISGATFEMVKNSFECTYRGKVEAKNKGLVDMYFVEVQENL